MTTDNSPNIEPLAKVMAATAMSQSVAFCMERKYLEKIDSNKVFKLSTVPCSDREPASWIHIDQIGKPLDDNIENCFSAIQKILYSCFMPKEVQLLFLVSRIKGENRMYLGIRDLESTNESKTAINLNEFIKGIWPGINCQNVVELEDEHLSILKDRISEGKIEDVIALTGIPSLETQYQSHYPATIDKLIAGMSRGKDFCYLVVADPVESTATESMLYNCKEMAGQAESLKTISITESISKGTSYSKSKSHAEATTTSISEAISKRDFSKLGKMALPGLGLAAAICPAAESVLDSISNTAGSIIAGGAELLGTYLGGKGVGAFVGSVVSSLIPQKTTTSQTSNSITDTLTETNGINESTSRSLSRNLSNKHIESVCEHLEFHSKRFETGKAIGMWKVGVYLMSSKSSDLRSGALQLRSILSGQDSIFEPIRIHNITDIIDDNDYRAKTIGRLSSPFIQVNDINNKCFVHPLGNPYNELKTILTTKELSYLINFPLRTVPGISVVDSCAEFSLNLQKKVEGSTEFGKLINGGTKTDLGYALSIDSLSKHTLLCGINGTGKTNTVQSILNSIDGKIPFLIIEPAKTEYVDWAIEYNKNHPSNPISIYIPGCKSYKDRNNNGEAIALKELRLNPFEPVWLEPEQDPNVLSHIDRLKSTFAAAFPMYDILPVLMEDLIYTLYSNKTTNWLTENPKYGVTKAPTLNGMRVYAEKVIHDCGYEKQIEANMKACMNTRIKSLLRGWKKDMLGCSKSTDWKELFEKPCVINLSYVGDDVDKAFFMALILQFMYEYRQALAETGKTDFNSNSCKHLTIIEEAHRVMMKCDNPDMPQYKSAMMFSNMLSEIRAYGEGMLLVDQVPTRLVPDAIKNTNTKICHRMVAEDDCKAIAESMGITEEQKKMIPKLLVGQCIVSTSLSTDKHWVQVNKVK